MSFSARHVSRQRSRWRLLVPITMIVAGWSSAVAATPPEVTAGLPAVGRDPTSRSRPITGWVAIGFGIAEVGGLGGEAQHFELAMAAGIHLLSLRLVLAADTNTTCGGQVCMGHDALMPYNSVKELALQYGLKARFPGFLATASAGVATVSTTKRGNDLQFFVCGSGCVYTYNGIDGHTVGATAELGGYLTWRYVSFGPTLIMDVNSVQSVWGVLIDWHFGWMGKTD
jgi:hypothetical protein